MKLQLDTTNKTIKIEEAVNLGELSKVLDQLFPNKEWEEYTLEINTTMEFAPNPWVAPIPYDPYNPHRPLITYCGGYGTTAIGIADVVGVSN